jgi:hypothetical protein
MRYHYLLGVKWWAEAAVHASEPSCDQTLLTRKALHLSTRNLKDPGANVTPIQLSFIRR